MKKYYTIREMAEKLEVTTQAIARKIRTRGIEPKKWDKKVRCGLYSQEQFEEIAKDLRLKNA